MIEIIVRIFVQTKQCGQILNLNRKDNHINTLLGRRYVYRSFVTWNLILKSYFVFGIRCLHPGRKYGVSLVRNANSVHTSGFTSRSLHICWQITSLQVSLSTEYSLYASLVYRNMDIVDIVELAWFDLFIFSHLFCWFYLNSMAFFIRCEHSAKETKKK